MAMPLCNPQPGFSYGEHDASAPLPTPPTHVRQGKIWLPGQYLVPSVFQRHAAKDQLLPTFYKISPKDVLYDLGEFSGNTFIQLIQGAQVRKRSTRFVAAVMLLSLATISLVMSGASVCHGRPAQEWSLSRIPPQNRVQRLWGPYSPYYSAEPYTLPPDDCQITQVNIIQRHGARVPTSGSSENIIAAVNKLQKAMEYTTDDLSFLSNYTYTLAGNGNLLPFGAVQSEEAGLETYKRYSHIISQTNMPFVRSSSGVRVVESATNWTAGFSLASNNTYSLPLSVILSESGNNTLDDNLCPNEGSSDSQTAIWAMIYGTPIAARLNNHAPGANLTVNDIPPLMSLCAFESIANDGPSPFCSLFSSQEFSQYEYFTDLGKYYGTGPGAYLGRVQGVGYINELLARLTGTPVRDNTQTNRTLDASPATFPLNRTVYADFSHDNQMVAIYTALGLFVQRGGDLDPKLPDIERTWIASRLTPFSARMITERLACTGRSRDDTYVRILVNDVLQSLSFCGGDKDGLCTLGEFVKSQVYARENGQGDFEKCFIS